MRVINNILFVSVILSVALVGCEDYVSIDPKGELEPTTYQDLRGIMDDRSTMNSATLLGELASDNLDISGRSLDRMNQWEYNVYTWQKEIYSADVDVPDWNIPYERVYHANMVLERLPETNTGTQEKREQLRGEALWHRAHAFFQVALLHAKVYDPSTASEDLGIPLRTTTDVAAPVERASLEETYNKIITDLKEAAKVLPESVELGVRPSKPAAYALLARVYLHMGMYDKASQYAADCLNIKNALIDYNNISGGGFGSPFDEFNKETISYATPPFFGYSFNTSSVTRALYDTYEDDDLRKDLFFRASPFGVSFTGSYAGFSDFTGMTTAEVYLVAAEGYARQGNYGQAEKYLNDLLENRYDNSSFTPYQSNDKEAFVKKIMEERRKELVTRNRRWFDLKRYNKDPFISVTLQRTIEGETYTLPPNDPKYVFPIPPEVIQKSNVEQNPRE